MRASVLATLCVLTVAAARPALADEGWYLVQITCAPELNHFSVDRVPILNPPHGGPLLGPTGALRPQAGATIARRGLYTSGMLAAHAEVCEIPGFQAPSRDDRRWPPFRAVVSARGDVVAVTVNGQPAGRVALGQTEGWKGTRSISADDDGVGVSLRTCVEDEAECKQRYLTPVR